MEQTKSLIEAIIQGIQEKKGKEITTVDLHHIVTAPCSCFVICTCGSPQQVSAVCDSVEEFTRKLVQQKPSAIAGRQNGLWVAMDYGTVMVHIFLEEARGYYELEKLWDDAELPQYPDID